MLKTAMMSRHSRLRLLAVVIMLVGAIHMAAGDRRLFAAQEDGAGCSPGAGTCVTRNGGVFEGKTCSSGGDTCFTCNRLAGSVCVTCWADAEGSSGAQSCN